MRTFLCVALGLAMALPAWAKAKDKAASEQSKDPGALLAAAAPFYDFSSTELKPWHLKATYQLYDEQGKPTEQGTYEYWWASPQVYRSTWTRPSASESDWHATDGKYRSVRSGARLRFYERDLPEMLFSPLPPKATSDLNYLRLDRREVKLGKVKFPCVTPIPKPTTVDGHVLTPVGGFATYCFDPNEPALRFTYLWDEVTTEYDRMAKMQNRYLPLLVRVASGKTMLFSATVGRVDGIKSDDPALTPAKDASLVGPVLFIPIGDMMNGALIDKTMPLYPPQARAARLQGSVVLAGAIGTDGMVHDVEVLASPGPSLAEAAEAAVSKWRYRPYQVNGKPIEVETTINVIFSLGG